ncbi:MAG TPA: S8 family serine peptidase [Candidatus Thermoplasmatota archaeon]|nr:S8 family serine peptidase [Candidatus Thermoplasmatota archaeon]
MRALALAWLLLLPTLGVAGAGEAHPRGDLIVTLREDAPLPARAIPFSFLSGYVLPNATAADAARLAADPRVERVDWARPLAFAAEARLPARAFTQLTRADATGLDGSGVTVAVLDSGIDATHPDLARRVKQNVRLTDGRFGPAVGDPDGHGTHVAGVLAASGDASQGRWTGVAPGVELVGIDITSRFTTSSAVLAYDWLLAHHEELDVRIVVNAWGRVGDGERYDPRDPVLRAIDRLVDRGIVVVFSASNRGPGPGTLSLEAMHPRVVTVGATDAAGLLARYSSRGPVAADTPWTKPDVVAPGDGVVAPRSLQSLPREGDPDPLHTAYSGTSQAAPHVAGIVAMMLQQRPQLTPADVARALRTSAIDLGAPGPDEATGYGLVDAHDALRVAAGLAPERTHILVTGGADRYHDAAPLTPTARRGILDLVTRADVVWETPFPVKPGARQLRVDAAAPGASDLAVELLHAGQLVRASVVDEPAPGVWTLRLRASVPAATTARAVIETDLPPNPARALVFDGGRDEPPPLAAAALDERLVLLGGALSVVGIATLLAAILLWPRREEK